MWYNELECTIVRLRLEYLMGELCGYADIGPLLLEIIPCFFVKPKKFLKTLFLSSFSFSFIKLVSNIAKNCN